jgi:hypothetical protein
LPEGLLDRRQEMPHAGVGRAPRVDAQPGFLVERCTAMVVERRRPFASVWDGDGELVHVVQDAFVTVPAPPGSRVTLRFEMKETEAPLLRQPSHKGLVILDARHDPRAGETRVVVSVCRAQRLAVESVDPEGVYRVRVESSGSAHGRAAVGAPRVRQQYGNRA